MTGRSSPRRLSPLMLLLALAGCAAAPRMAHLAPIRPVSFGEDHQIARADGYYASAKAAIGRRDYAQALELLQAAGASRQGDVRVLNAFGVVYDKLGRFDLSERYYAQAAALDPGSSVLANNITYSRSLRASAASSAAAPILDARAAPAPQVFAPGLAVVRLPAVSPGRPVAIADATGARGGVEPVRQALMRLGWSVPAVEPRPAKRIAVTTISYPTYNLSTARALARTLPRGVELVDCGAVCDRVRLSLGADTAGWPMITRTVRNP